MQKTVTITLPSFLRRALKAYALKAVIRSAGAELARIGRSRNWHLTATPETINDIIVAIEQSNEESWLWVAKKLKQENRQFSHLYLITIAQKNPSITINELMAKTDCTVAQARKVIDELEWLD